MMLVHENLEFSIFQTAPKICAYFTLAVTTVNQRELPVEFAKNL